VIGAGYPTLVVEKALFFFDVSKIRCNFEKFLMQEIAKWQKFY